MSLNNMGQLQICFLLPEEGHVPSPLLCLLISALVHGHSLTCLDQRRWPLLCLNRLCPIDQAAAQPRAGKGRARERGRECPQRHHSTLQWIHFGNVTPSLTLPEDSKGCRAVPASHAIGVTSRPTLSCLARHRAILGMTGCVFL